ncbi:MAG: SigE family RNA polymerase sigma factor, partial [Jatrophihabitantaceae bacterium]
MGDSTEFSTFVRLNSTALLRAAFLLTGDRLAAEELLQDTFVRLYPQWGRVVGAEVPMAYVRRSLTNNFLNGRRRRAASDVLFADPPDHGYEQDLAGSFSDRELVRHLLDELSPKQRAVLVLRFFHDLSDAEIAAEVGCRQGTVRS